MASLDERGFVADGEVVWSWHPDAGVKFRGIFSRGDGGKRAGHRAGHRGEHEVTVKTNAQGMSGCFGVPVVTTLVRFFCCVRGCGCIVHPAFPAPSIFLGRMDRTQLGRHPRREMAEARPHDALLNLNDARRDQCCAKWHYPSNTASAPFTASALSVTVFSSEAACTEMFSAKNLASVI